MRRRRDRIGFRVFFQAVETTGLKPMLREVANAHGTTLHDVYTDANDAPAVSARIESWWRLARIWMRSRGEIASLYDRERSSIAHALALLEGEARTAGVCLSDDTVRPLASRAASRRRR